MQLGQVLLLIVCMAWLAATQKTEPASQEIVLNAHPDSSVETASETKSTPAQTPLKYKFKTIYGGQFTIDVLPTDTVKDAKQTIFEQRKIPVDEQRIIFSGKQLRDDEIMSDYVIPEGYYMHLVLSIKPPAGYQRIPSGLDPPVAKPPAQFVPEIEKTSDKAVEYTFKMLTGGTFRIAVEPTDTVVKVKSRIEKQKNFPANQQRFMLGTVQMQDALVFRSYDTQGRAVQLLFKPKPAN